MDKISTQQDIFFDSWQQLDALYTEYARTKGLAYTELVVLSYLSMDSYTQKQLCEKTLMPKQTVNSVIKSLAKKGLVVLKQSDTDRRAKTVVLTEKGRQLRREAMDDMARAEHAAIGRIGTEDWENLVRILDRYSAFFKEEMAKI